MEESPRTGTEDVGIPGASAAGNPGNRFSVARFLEHAILSGRLKPGARLPEIRIARELGVSQSSVREALLDLEALGLVFKFPNRGSTVVQLTEEDIAHIYEVRLELEPLACRGAIAFLTPVLTEQLQNCLSEMRSAADSSDFQRFSLADIRFHRLLWAAQPNRYLERSLLSICLPLFAHDLVRRLSVPHLDYTRTIVQHQLIVDTLCSRDEELTIKVIRHMIELWMRQDRKDYVHIQQHLTENAEEIRDTEEVLMALRHLLEVSDSFNR